MAFDAAWIWVGSANRGQEFVLEHARHHASTVDLLIQGEFGWDPEEFHYAPDQWEPIGTVVSWSTKETARRTENIRYCA